jgi:hypothetical protein
MIAWGPIAPDLTGKSCNQDLLVLAHTTSPWNRIGTRRIGVELQRLATAVSEGAAVKTLLEAIKTRERERDALQAKLEHLDGLQKASESWDARAYGEKVREAIGSGFWEPAPRSPGKYSGSC